MSEDQELKRVSEKAMELFFNKLFLAQITGSQLLEVTDSEFKDTLFLHIPKGSKKTIEDLNIQILLKSQALKLQNQVKENIIKESKLDKFISFE